MSIVDKFTRLHDVSLEWYWSSTDMVSIIFRMIFFSDHTHILHCQLFWKKSLLFHSACKPGKGVLACLMMSSRKWWISHVILCVLFMIYPHSVRLKVWDYGEMKETWPKRWRRWWLGQPCSEKSTERRPWPFEIVAMAIRIAPAYARLRVLFRKVDRKRYLLAILFEKSEGWSRLGRADKYRYEAQQLFVDK